MFSVGIVGDSAKKVKLTLHANSESDALRKRLNVCVDLALGEFACSNNPVNVFSLAARQENFSGSLKIMNNAARELWFVTGSQHLYGPGPLALVAEHSTAIAASLNAEASLPVRVVFKPVLTTADEILHLCRDANTSDTCVGLVFWMHTFSPAKMWIAGLTSLRKPFLQLHNPVQP